MLCRVCPLPFPGHRLPLPTSNTASEGLCWGAATFRDRPKEAALSLLPAGNQGGSLQLRRRGRRGPRRKALVEVSNSRSRLAPGIVPAAGPRLGISKLGRVDGLSPLARRSPAREEDPPRGRREAALTVALWAPSGVKPLRRRAMKVEFAPLNIPLARRLQTAAVFQWVFSFLLLAQCCCGIFMIFVFGDYWFISAFYALWLYLDWETPQTGGRRSKWVRNWTVWRYFKEYFPIQLIKTSDLDPSQNYLFGFHPHGVLVAGAFGNFCTEYTGFKKLFPGLTPYLHILPFWFRCPFFRDYIMCAGLVSASKKSVSHVLSHEGGGNVAVIVIGGAAESLDARPGSLTLSILKRKGFIKVALKHGWEPYCGETESESHH
ncbi:2-acylglycerol O-acyltransferase 1 [Podarcis lilfordi]|uniref:Acyltransferase n=1 Tax=Podarcis lilfordi TaxID=74358 RepID=A0AA35KDH2_9SAUR|nr:2-acylglycerol O-acyltransferase 1 [Podarcis lilfordi]